MKYRVITDFKDLKDHDYIYKAGDEYPRKEIKLEDVDPKRIKELTTTKNKLKKVIIEAEEEVPVEDEKATEEAPVEEEKEEKETKNK